jgi:hypothetical protein
MYPPAIIFVNGNTDGYGSSYGDLDSYSKQLLVTQLELDETMTGDEFDARVVVDPNYPAIIHSSELRILVIKADFRDYTNRQYADVVMFVKGGLAAIENNNFGPPGLTLPMDRLEIHQLLRYNNSPYTTNLPASSYPYSRPRLGGIVADEMLDPSGVHSVNPDNEYNNPDFINRR